MLFTYFLFKVWHESKFTFIILHQLQLGCTVHVENKFIYYVYIAYIQQMNSIYSSTNEFYIFINNIYIVYQQTVYIHRVEG